MSKLWKIEFTVKSFMASFNPFPVDMLRYDRALPYESKDWDLIIESLRNPMEYHEEMKSIPIQLIHYSHGNKQWKPTAKRWNSFQWHIINIGIPSEFS